MTRFAKRAESGKRISTATYTLAALCGALTAWPQAAGAQHAGGARLGGGQVVLDAPWGDAPGQLESPQCIRRALDNRRSFNADNDQVTVWLSVRQPATAVVLAHASANGPDSGTLAISITQNGIPIAHSQESRGLNIIDAEGKTSVSLVPGRQYKFTAKAAVNRTKRLDLLNLNVGVGVICL